jgi:uncharacterized SAM-binding protein YcdF (DUF218 family)
VRHLRTRTRALMFFLSKLLAVLTNPVNLLGLLFAGSLLAAWKQRWPWVKRLLATQVALLLLAGVAPTGHLLTAALENRIPAATLPEKVDGIIVLGGALDPWLSARRGQPVLNDAAERLTAFASLARRYPQARLVVSGGNGLLFKDQPPETEATAVLLEALGVERSRLVLEGTSRNTHENVLHSAALVHPVASETWVLVTSAAHMPRALSVFRRQGWAVLPHPVDYRTEPNADLGINLQPLHGLAQFSDATHEVLGLLSYRLLDRTEAWWPAP